MFKIRFICCLMACAGLIGGGSSVHAAYSGPPPALSVVANVGQQPVGTAFPGQALIPQINQNLPAFAPVPSPPPNGVVRGVASFTEAIGRNMNIASDGVRPISLAPPGLGATPWQAALVVAPSPNPSYQCPYTASINQTANTTVITNTGGTSIYVCNAVIINGATAQSVTILEGTGTACATNPINWLGGSGATAALAVNGGFSLMGVNWAMQKRGDNVCVLVSGSTNVSGSLTYGLY